MSLSQQIKSAVKRVIHEGEPSVLVTGHRLVEVTKKELEGKKFPAAVAYVESKVDKRRSKRIPLWERVKGNPPE